MGKLNQTLSFDVSKEGNGKVKNEKKNAEKWKYITVKLMIELGFKLGVVSFFHFSHPPTSFSFPAPRSPLPAPRFIAAPPRCLS